MVFCGISEASHDWKDQPAEIASTSSKSPERAPLFGKLLEISEPDSVAQDAMPKARYPQQLRCCLLHSACGDELTVHMEVCVAATRQGALHPIMNLCLCFCRRRRVQPQLGGKRSAEAFVAAVLHAELPPSLGFQTTQSRFCLIDFKPQRIIVVYLESQGLKHSSTLAPLNARVLKFLKDQISYNLGAVYHILLYPRYVLWTINSVKGRCYP